MRPKGLIALLVIILLVGLTAYLLSDWLIEGAIESVGESIVGAKVEIDNLKFSLLELAISLDRLQVTNPNDTWKNLFETSRMSFDMEVAPLARKKFIINDVTIADIRIGTKRKTDGKIPKDQREEPPGWVSEAAESLKRQVAAAPVLNLGMLKKKINVDSLVAAFDIQSVNRIEQTKQDAQMTFDKWRNTIAEFRPQNDLAKIEQQVKEITSQEISGSLDNLVATLNKTKKVVDNLNTLKKVIESKKKASTEDFKEITNRFSRVDNWIEDDFNAIKAKANIGEFSAQNVGKMLFGDIVISPTIRLLEYVGIARKYMPVAQQFLSAGKVQKPPRFEGQDIRFPLVNAKPDFLLERIFISGASNQEDTSKVLHVSGEVKGITSQPRLYGKPLTFALSAKLPNSNAYSVNGELNHITDIPEDKVQVKAAGIRFGNIALPKRPYMPSEIAANKGDISANFNFIGDKLDFKINFAASPVNFNFSNNVAKDNAVAKVTRGVFDSIEHLTLSAGISGPTNSLGLKISSNIDDILAQRIKGVIGESARLARAEIRKRIDAIVEPKKQEALAFIDQNKIQINSEIDKIQKTIDGQLALIDAKKKEIEAEIDKKKEEGLKDVKGKLKDLFKKN